MLSEIYILSEFRELGLGTFMLNSIRSYLDELNIKFSKGEVSRLIIKTTVGDALMRQILRQINKLIEVIAVSDNESTYLKGILRDENLL